MQLQQLLVFYRSTFEALAKAWLEEGASSFSLWSHQQQIACWPARFTPDCDVLVAPVKLDGSVIGEIHLTGITEATIHERLQIDATLIAGMASQARDMNLISVDLLDTRDQLLALYDLLKSNRNCIELQQMVRELAKSLSSFISAEYGFIALDIPDQPMLTSIIPDPRFDPAVLAEFIPQLQNQSYILALKDLPEGLRDVLIMPFHVRGVSTALLGLANKKNGNFNSSDIKLLKAIAEYAGFRLENILTYQENLELVKFQHEIKLARQVQERLLPQKLPNIAGIEVAAVAKPAFLSGGDYYDFYQNSPDSLTFTVADVCGNGFSASLLMAMTRTVVRAQAGNLENNNPGDIVQRTNIQLYDDFNALSMFATLFIGRYEKGKKQFIFSNAGHSPVIYYACGCTPRFLEADGTAVGILPNLRWSNQVLSLSPGDILVIGTDGLTEARGPDEQLYGYDRLLALIALLGSYSAQEIANHIMVEIQKFTGSNIQDDDQTLIVIKFTQP